MLPLTVDPRSKSVGFVGLGNMGKPMVKNLLRLAPDSVTISGRNRSQFEKSSLAGARWVIRPVDLAEVAGVVIVMVPDIPEIMNVVFGPEGIAESDQDCVVVVCSTVSPEGLRSIDAELRARTANRIRLVDAPVSGGTEGAAAGTLSIMVGGDAADVLRAARWLAALGSPVHLGSLGAGETAKACNQLIVAATMAAVAEAAVIAALLGGGYAGSRLLETKRGMIAAKDYAVQGAARFMVKDLAAATAAARATGTWTPQLDALTETFEAVVAEGLGDDDLAVVHRLIALRSSAV
jgi:2-hydroxy-3-oxopropionate reductase